LLFQINDTKTSFFLWLACCLPSHQAGASSANVTFALEAMFYVDINLFYYLRW
jgi:hypothetical protein